MEQPEHSLDRRRGRRPGVRARPGRRQPAYNVTTLVVRFWRGGSGDRAADLRGQVVHVQTGATARFVRPAGLIAYLTWTMGQALLGDEQPRRRGKL